MAEEESENENGSKTKIERMLEEGEEESNLSFSHADIKQEFKKVAEKTKGQWMMGIYGAEGTAKSGALLDLRTPEEIENGKKIVVIDVDNSCRPLWEDIWNYDPGIRIINPLVKIGEGTDKRPSYIASYRKVIATLSWIEENIDKKNIGYVAIDGFDTFLKWCEFIMKDVEFGDIDVHNSNVGYDWGKRNRRYYKVLDWLKSLSVPTFVTAHRDKQKNFEEGTTEDRGPNWHKGSKQNTADELFQIVETKKGVKQRGTYEVATYIGKIHKWKGNVQLEQKKIKMLESKTDPTGDGGDDEYTWYGLVPKIHKFLNEIEDEKDKPPTGYLVDEEKDKKEESMSGDELIDEVEEEVEKEEDLTENEEELLNGFNEEDENAQANKEKGTTTSDEASEQQDEQQEEQQEQEEEQEEENDQPKSSEGEEDGDWFNDF